MGLVQIDNHIHEAPIATITCILNYDGLSSQYMLRKPRIIALFIHSSVLVTARPLRLSGERLIDYKFVKEGVGFYYETSLVQANRTNVLNG
jgi:hypothetical protein